MHSLPLPLAQRTKLNSSKIGIICTPACLLPTGKQGLSAKIYMLSSLSSSYRWLLLSQALQLFSAKGFCSGFEWILLLYFCYYFLDNFLFFLYFWTYYLDSGISCLNYIWLTFSLKNYFTGLLHYILEVFRIILQSINSFFFNFLSLLFLYSKIYLASYFYFFHNVLFLFMSEASS